MTEVVAAILLPSMIWIICPFVGIVGSVRVSGAGYLVCIIRRSYVRFVGDLRGVSRNSGGTIFLSKSEVNALYLDYVT